MHQSSSVSLIFCKWLGFTIAFLFLEPSSMGSPADPKPVYLVSVGMKESGNRLTSSTIALDEAQKGEIRSVSANGAAEMIFAGTITRLSEAWISLDYHIAFKHKDRVMDIGKSLVKLRLGSSEKTTIRDTIGNDLLLEVNVQRR